SPSVMISSPARSWSRMASTVASSCAASSRSGAISHRSARTRGTCFDSLTRSISQSGCGYEPTREVGSSIKYLASPPVAFHAAGKIELLSQSLFERINGLAGRIIGRSEHGLVAHAPPGFEVRGVGEAVILHLQLPR